MKSIQDKFKEHVDNKCKYCNRKNCKGIVINTKGEALCEVNK